MIRNRKIGLPLATILVAGNMMGSGIYLLPASLAATGSSTMLAWLIALVGALMIAAVLGILGRVAPEAGGLCGFPAAAFGRLAGFQSSALYWICAWIGNIVIAIGAIGYLSKLIPWLADSTHIAYGVLALLWAATLLNVLGPRIACQLQSLMLVGLIPVLLVALGGWWAFDAKTFVDSWNISGRPLLAVLPDAVLLVFWAFTGLESASIGMQVVTNPERNVPLATIGGVAITGLVYVAASAAIMGLIPAHTLMKSTAPFADAAQGIIGTSGAVVVAALAFIKTCGTLIGFTLVTAQAGKVAAERGYFPPVFARTDTNNVPVSNLFLVAGIVTVVTLATISPTLNQQFTKLADMSVLLCLLAYLYACAAALRTSRFHIPVRYRVFAVLAALLILWVIAMSSLTMLTLAAGTLIVVSVLCVITHRRTLSSSRL